MKQKPKIIAITGAESTGKSTLAKSLASHYNAPYIPEIAREYVEKLDREYTFDDVNNIAKLQVELLSKQINPDHRFIFLDTWLIITKVWFEKKFKNIPIWLEKAILETPVDLFLVCDIDLPWIYDPVRENGGIQREVLHCNYLDELNKYHFRYNIVKGKDENRFQEALGFLSLLE